MINNLKKVLKTGQPIERELRTPDGKTLLKKIMPFKTETGAIDGVVLTFTDISRVKETENKVKAMNAELERRVLERTRELELANDRLKAEIEAKKESEKQLIQAKAEAESADRAKSTFLANMSHEIRTPINAVVGFAEMLSLTPLTGEQLEYLKYIKVSGQSLMALINDILDFSKIEAGKMELENIEFDVRRIANEAVSVHRLMAAGKKLDISLSIDEKIDFKVVGDPNRLRQVLSNLLSNAVKFTDKGRIEVKITLLAPAANGRALVGVSVRDEGIGISEENRKKLFNRFTQLNESNCRKYEGTGLGLAISNQLVKLMGSPGIEVKSRPNEGSEFYFAIDFQTGGPAERDDLLKPEPGAHETATVCDPPVTRKLKILLAEDNMINAALVVKILGKMGNEVSTVTNGADAVRIAMANNFDVIILDVQMPVMDGFEAAINIRKAGVNTPIIALTASAMKGDRELCERAGMNAYITKPLNRAQLEAVVCSLAGGARPETMPDTATKRRLENTDANATALDYNQLRLNLEDEEIMKDAAGYLVDHFNSYFKNILNAWKHDDITEFKRLAHKMKGTAANACAVTIAARLEMLETIDGNDWSVKARAVLDEMLEEFHKYKEEAAKHNLL